MAESNDSFVHIVEPRLGGSSNSGMMISFMNAANQGRPES